MIALDNYVSHKAPSLHTMLNLTARSTLRNSSRLRLVNFPNPSAQTAKRTIITLKDQKVCERYVAAFSLVSHIHSFASTLPMPLLVVKGVTGKSNQMATAGFHSTWLCRNPLEAKETVRIQSSSSPWE